MNEKEVIDKTRLWISSVVIGLNLCPFAQRVFKADQIRYCVTQADDQEVLLQLLSDEMTSLAQTSSTSIETTLLIHPKALSNFLDYVDFLAIADQRLRALRLQSVIQIASFHPQYQFADTEPDSVENYTNRSPYPMMHLLREESISKVAGDPDSLLEIPFRNKELMKAMGHEKIVEMLESIQNSHLRAGFDQLRQE